MLILSNQSQPEVDDTLKVNPLRKVCLFAKTQITTVWTQDNHRKGGTWDHPWGSQVALRPEGPRQGVVSRSWKEGV